MNYDDLQQRYATQSEKPDISLRSLSVVCIAATTCHSLAAPNVIICGVVVLWCSTDSQFARCKLSYRRANLNSPYHRLIHRPAWLLLILLVATLGVSQGRLSVVSPPRDKIENIDFEEHRLLTTTTCASKWACKAGRIKKVVGYKVHKTTKGKCQTKCVASKDLASYLAKGWACGTC